MSFESEEQAIADAEARGRDAAAKPCKADLAALEQTFRAGYAAGVDWSQGPYANIPNNNPTEAWAAFLAGEMKAFET